MPDDNQTVINRVFLITNPKILEGYKKDASENLTEVRLASGGIQRSNCYFITDFHPCNVKPPKLLWNAILPEMPTAIGYRLLELKNGLELPVGEETFNMQQEPDLDVRMTPKNVVEWRVWPRNGSGALVSWDEGKTWEGPKGVGGYIELPIEGLQKNPEPLIEFRYIQGFRVFRKVYQVGKGFVQAPSSNSFTVLTGDITSTDF